MWTTSKRWFGKGRVWKKAEAWGGGKSLEKNIDEEDATRERRKGK